MAAVVAFTFHCLSFNFFPFCIHKEKTIPEEESSFFTSVTKAPEALVGFKLLSSLKLQKPTDKTFLLLKCLFITREKCTRVQLRNRNNDLPTRRPNQYVCCSDLFLFIIINSNNFSLTCLCCAWQHLLPGRRHVGAQIQ